MGLATAPPYKPECKSRFGPITSTSSSTFKTLGMDGVSLAMIPVSEMRIASHLRRALLT